MQVGRQRKNIGARHHHFADRDAVEFDGAVNHLFLKLGNLAELAAGGHDEFEFVGRVNGAAAAGGLCAEQPQNQAAGAAHEEQDGARKGEEGLHGRGDGEGDLLGALQGQSLRDQFAQDHVHVGDQAEGDGDRDGVGVDGRVRNFVDEPHAFHQAGDHGFADPAEGQADHGDAQLNAVYDFVEVLVEALHDARADASRCNELLDAGIAHAHQGEFGCREEGIGRHQEKDQKDPEQHKGDHGRVILTFAKLQRDGSQYVAQAKRSEMWGQPPSAVLGPKARGFSVVLVRVKTFELCSRTAEGGCPHMVSNRCAGSQNSDPDIRYPFKRSLV